MSAEGFTPEWDKQPFPTAAWRMWRRQVLQDTGFFTVDQLPSFGLDPKYKVRGPIALLTDLDLLDLVGASGIHQCGGSVGRGTDEATVTLHRD